MDNDKRPKFGNRFLDEKSDIFTHNAWDNVMWDEDFKKDIVEKVASNSRDKVSDEKALEFETNAFKYWDNFYEKHENKFFKDRHWILTEFPELTPNETRKNILELGCGVGNTVFPLLEIDNHKSLFIYCCDFSEKAVKLVRDNSLYDENRCNAFVLDITGDWKSSPLIPQSLDIITMIFVLSAIDPKCQKQVILNMIPYLKPNGIILFRDYGQYDMAQIRFNKGRCIKDRFYVRGDGTRAYFFEENEVDLIFTETKILTKINLHVDRRLQVNRANKKKMYHKQLNLNLLIGLEYHLIQSKHKHYIC
ncbi:methyltransferase-like protein [Dermatophagoides farinae]|uniref:tRNA N(3)-methylcytidine methyltransferase n=1 Tax=Dermatophagoides farinae TaxID=6954 RepID=A0A9D4P1X1_DERFA|nr:methyltransferase-like protein [Dermatophagoides farinae]